MNIAEKIERSKSSEKIDFAALGCLHQADPLVKVVPTTKITIEPIWQVTGDFEGRLYAEYIAKHPEYDGVYVRAGLLERLQKAAHSLDDNFKMVVRAGHRPLEVQKQLLEDVKQDYKRRHPQVNDQTALEHARLYVTDPATNELPPHCCGAAVDIDLFDVGKGQLVDFGSRMNEDADISHLHSQKVLDEQRANRLMLLTTMLNAGFASFHAEWWHFSYGDGIWAWFYGHDSCLYAPIKL